MINISYFSIAAAQIPQRGSKYLDYYPSIDILFQFTSFAIAMVNHHGD